MLGYIFGTPGVSGFGSASTALQVATKYAEGHNGQHAIITGAASGIGFETAKAFVAIGIHVTIACRNVKSGEEAANEIRKEYNSANLSVLELDLSSGASIKRFVDTYLATDKPLHYLINNAGVMACPKSQTVDGFETQFGTNHLGHFLLTVLLLDKLKSSGSARIVTVSSSAHARAPAEAVPFDDLDGNKFYDPWQRYAISKISNILFASELQRRLEEEGNHDVVSVSLHPGGIHTNLQRHVSFGLRVVFAILSPIFKSPAQGASTTVFCALYPEVNNEAVFKKGGFYDDCNLAVSPATFKLHPKYNDVETAKKLWQVSESLWKEKGFLA